MTNKYHEPTWWLSSLPDPREVIQLIELLGDENVHFGHKQPNNNPNAVFWPYLDLDKSVSDSKKMLVEILLSKKIIKD